MALDTVRRWVIIRTVEGAECGRIRDLRSPSSPAPITENRTVHPRSPDVSASSPAEAPQAGRPVDAGAPAQCRAASARVPDPGRGGQADESGGPAVTVRATRRLLGLTGLSAWPASVRVGGPALGPGGPQGRPAARTAGQERHALDPPDARR